METSIQITSNVNKLLEQSYNDSLNDFRDYLKTDFSKTLLTDDFHNSFYKIVFSESINSYSPLKYYWLKNVEDFFYILELHYDYEQDTLSIDEDLSDEEREEEICDSWQKTSFAVAFETMIEDGLSPMDASMALISLMESQILSFCYLHFSDEEIECETAFLYNANPELGDYENRLYIGSACEYIEFENTPELFPSIPINLVDQLDKIIEIDTDGESESYPMMENEPKSLASAGTIRVIPAFDSVEVDKVLEALTNCLANSKVSSHFKNLVDALVITNGETSMNENLPGYFYLNPTSIDEKTILTSIAKYVAEVINNTVSYSTEEDYANDFSNPFTNKKDPFFVIAQSYIEKLILNELTDAQIKSFEEAVSKAKKMKLVSVDFLELI